MFQFECFDRNGPERWSAVFGRARISLAAESQRRSSQDGSAAQEESRSRPAQIPSTGDISFLILIELILIELIFIELIIIELIFIEFNE